MCFVAGMRKRYFSRIPVLLMAVGMLSCSHVAEEKNEESDRLYHETLKLIKIYKDSLSRVTDPQELKDIFTNFNIRLEKLNFDVPPDTDLQLNEGKNDTLFIKISELRHIYDIKRAELGDVPDQKVLMRSDSLPDSLYVAVDNDTISEYEL